MKKSNITAFLNTAIFNTAAGNESLSFSKFSRVLYIVIAVTGLAFTFPFSIPENKQSLIIKLLLLVPMLIIMGLFATFSTKYAKATESMNIFKSIILFDCQCACISFLAPIINYAFYESVDILIIGIAEMGMVVVIVVVATITMIRNNIKNGAYTKSTVVKPLKNPMLIGLLAYVVTVNIARKSIGIMMHLVTFAFCLPFIILTYNLMQLYYARKYEMEDMINNESYIRRVHTEKTMRTNGD